MKTTDAELRKLAHDAFQEKGWKVVRFFAKAAARHLRNCYIAAKLKPGKCGLVRYPRVEVSHKSKMGRLDTFLTPNQQDMERIQKRLTAAEFAAFKIRFYEMLHGVEHTIEAISLVTCQATGRPAARRIADRGGWLRTLHPTVARKLQLKERSLGSWVH